MTIVVIVVFCEGVLVTAASLLAQTAVPGVKASLEPTATPDREMRSLRVRPGDWPQWLGSGVRNNTPPGTNIHVTFDPLIGKVVSRCR